MGSGQGFELMLMAFRGQNNIKSISRLFPIYVDTILTSKCHQHQFEPLPKPRMYITKVLTRLQCQRQDIEIEDETYIAHWTFFSRNIKKSHRAVVDLLLLLKYPNKHVLSLIFDT